MIKWVINQLLEDKARKHKIGEEKIEMEILWLHKKKEKTDRGFGKLQ